MKDDHQTQGILMKKSLPLSRVYQLIEPGPVVMVTTAYCGKTNIMTMSWLTMMEFEPPLIGCVMSDRNYSYELFTKSNECVINIPTVEIAKKVVGCGNTSGKKSDKFSRFDLTPMKASTVEAPLIDECYANLECKIVDKKLMKQYGFIIMQVTKAWINPANKNPKTIHHRGNGVFSVDGKILKLPSKMK